MLEVGAGSRRESLPPFGGMKIEIGGTDQVAYTAAFMRFFDARPETVEFLLQRFRFVCENSSLRHQVKETSALARHGSVELPAWKNRHSAGADCALDCVFV